MPVFTFDLDDFCDLVGRRITEEELADRLPMLAVPVEEMDDLTEIKVEVFPNRPDMLSVEGLARAYAGFIDEKVGLPKYEVKDTKYPLIVDPSVQNVRPYIVGAVVRNISFTDASIASIMQYQEKLHITHSRNRRKASIGLYDAEGLEFPLRYRAVGRSEVRFVPLQSTEEMTPEEILTKNPKGIEYAHLVGDKCPYLTDNKETVLSFPPIINSQDTAVTEDTESLVIDVTGLSLITISQALNMVVTALADRGGIIESIQVNYPYSVNGKNEITTPNLTPFEWELSREFVINRIGRQFDFDAIENLLNKMRFDVRAKKSEDKMKVIVPAYRTDIMHPIDFVEDIAIAYGYENFEPTFPNLSTFGKESPVEILTRRLANLLVGFGANEVMTFILTSLENNFTKMGLKIDLSKTLQIQNPKTNRFTIVRTWLAPCFLEIFSNNTKAPYPQRLFEIDECFERDNDLETRTHIYRTLCYAEADSHTGYSHIKGVMDSLAMHLQEIITLKPITHPSFIEGRSAALITNETQIGMMGEIHPQILVNWGINTPVSLLEIRIDHFLDVRV
ncbi:MAG: phenylalanine--tRNA ligase subunit beta [Promethearchaeota archaeon]